MKKTPLPESILEKEIAQRFQDSGWDCMFHTQRLKTPDGRMFCPDIVLAKDGKVYGYVECFTPQLLTPDRVNRITYGVEELKPEIFVLTDGVNYEVYFDGKYLGTMTVPMSFSRFGQLKRFDYYAKRLNGGKDLLEEKDGENSD